METSVVEEWRDMVGHEDLYKISNLGQIYSKLVDRIVKSSYDYAGYKIRTHKSGGKCFVTKVHRAVALAFLPNPENKPYVNHENGVKDDNRLCNLSWVTASENQKHSAAMNPKRSGAGHFFAKMTWDDVEYIRLSPDNLSQSQLARKFKVSQPRISEVISGNSYRGFNSPL